eukprot:GILI01004312.1.p1 GENE.GILI01004312.1~~GILI01004312.1.p1  ORF type:complete len:771 (-),score=279.60 GILI01004312.1:192-2504(-)
MKVLSLFVLLTVLGAACATTGHPYFLIKDGSRPKTYTFELFTAAGEKVLEGITHKGEKAMTVLLENIADVMDAPKSSFQIIAYPYKEIGFAVRNARGKVAAWSAHSFPTKTALDAELTLVRSIARYASVKTMPSGANAAEVSSKFEIVEDKTGGFVFMMEDAKTGSKIAESYPTKGDLLRGMGEMFQAQQLSSASLVDETKTQSPDGSHFMTFSTVQPEPATNEPIDPVNDPAQFNITNLVTNYYKMKEANWTQGRSAAMAWADTYWPTFKDGLLDRWQDIRSYRLETRCLNQTDCLSPLEKYDMAFNDWNPKHEFFHLRPYDPNLCSKNLKEYPSDGVLFDTEYYESLGPAAMHSQELTRKGVELQGNLWCRDGIDNSKNGLTDECDMRGCEERKNGRSAMLERWFGLCHAWTPASILYPEPQHGVTVNDVPFQVSDIKGLLMSFNYQTYFLSHRCELQDDEAARDQFGRIVPDECRDTNPGAFHIVLTNLLAREQRAFAFDRSWDASVWNQPVVGFEVLKEESIATADEACKWLGSGNFSCAEPGVYTWNRNATKWVGINVAVHWITESTPSRFSRASQIKFFTQVTTYHYLLELNDEGEILGGEWLFAHPDHPDFLWLPYDVYPHTFNKYVKQENILDILKRSLTRNEAVTFGSAPVQPAANDVKDYTQYGSIASSIEVGDSFVLNAVTVNVEWVNEKDVNYDDLQVLVQHSIYNTVLSGAQLKANKALLSFANANAKGTWTLTLSSRSGKPVPLMSRWTLSLTEKK